MTNISPHTLLPSVALVISDNNCISHFSITFSYPPSEQYNSVEFTYFGTQPEYSDYSRCLNSYPLNKQIPFCQSLPLPPTGLKMESHVPPEHSERLPYTDNAVRSHKILPGGPAPSLRYLPADVSPLEPHHSME
jgi:hypothetical protein